MFSLFCLIQVDLGHLDDIIGTLEIVEPRNPFAPLTPHVASCVARERGLHGEGVGSGVRGGGGGGGEGGERCGKGGRGRGDGAGGVGDVMVTSRGDGAAKGKSSQWIPLPRLGHAAVPSPHDKAGEHPPHPSVDVVNWRAEPLSVALYVSATVGAAGPVAGPQQLKDGESAQGFDTSRNGTDGVRDDDALHGFEEVCVHSL